MDASFMIAQVETTMSNYTNQYHRLGMRDVAIWQSLEPIYARPEEYDVVATSTREEAFDRMVKDNWHVDMGDHFFGLDYETIDDCVMQYLKDNKLVASVDDDE
jgi:predicted Zn-dependent protease